MFPFLLFRAVYFSLTAAQIAANQMFSQRHIRDFTV